MKTLLSISADTEVTVTLRGNQETINTALMLLASLEWASSVGHSATYAMPIDGDGGTQFSVVLPPDFDKAIRKECGERCNAMSAHGAEIELVQSTSAVCLGEPKSSKIVWTQKDGVVK